MTDEKFSDDSLSDENFWKKTGDDHFKDGKFEDAIKCYKEAIEINPSFTAAWNNLGYTYIKLGRIDEAKKCKDIIKSLKEHQDVITSQLKIPSNQLIQQVDQEIVPDEDSDEVPEQSENYNIILLGLLIEGFILLFLNVEDLLLNVIKFIFLLITWIVSAYFVHKDARRIGANKHWGIIVFLLWGIALPIYLIMRFFWYRDKTNPQNQNESPKRSSVVTALLIIGGIILFIIVAAIVAAFIFGMLGTSADYSSNTQTGLSIEQIKSNAQKVSYDDLFRYNERYVGDIVYYRGKIIQSQNPWGDSYVLRIATKKMDYFDTYIEDILWVDYSGTRFLEGDIIDLWGRVEGLSSYQAVLGNEITIPHVKSLHMEYVRKAEI